MAEDDSFDRRLFERIRAFEWNAEKAASNRRKHGIDFDDAVEVFYSPCLIRRSDRNTEARWLAIGETQGRVLAVAFTGAETPFGSSRHAARETMKNERIIKRKWDDRRKGKTDWAVVDALSDAEIAAAVRNDPDAVPVDIDWSDAELVIPPKKKAISIRVDADVLDYFKQHGSGYQRRINAVLRSYMEQARARLSRKKRT